MGKDKKITMPQSTAGLVRYFDDYKETVQIKPEYILYITTFIIIVEMILRHTAAVI